jgi:hypothetical protein
MVLALPFAEVQAVSVSIHHPIGNINECRASSLQLTSIRDRPDHG